MFKRHDLVWADINGRTEAFRYFKENNFQNIEESAAEALIMDSVIPGIVRRQENESRGYLEVGFSSHNYISGVRLRVSSRVPINSIKETRTPFLVLDSIKNYERIPNYDTIRKIILSGDTNRIRLGVYGSTAMQIVTGLAYMRESSDIDIYAKKKGPLSNLSGFYEDICRMEEQDKIKIDVEVELREGFGVKLKEIFSPQRTVLAKGFRSVEIFNKSEIDEIKQL